MSGSASAPAPTYDELVAQVGVLTNEVGECKGQQKLPATVHNISTHSLV